MFTQSNLYLRKTKSKSDNQRTATAAHRTHARMLSFPSTLNSAARSGFVLLPLNNAYRTSNAFAANDHNTIPQDATLRTVLVAKPGISMAMGHTNF